MNGHFNLCHDTDILKLYTEISSLNQIFHEKAASTGSRVSFLENRGSIKTIKQRGNPDFFFKIRILLITRLLQGPMYAKLRLPPQNRSFSRCILRQTPTLTGPNDRIEPNYFLYRDVNFLAEKKSCFFGSPECVWLLRASPAAPGPKKPGKYQKYRLFMKNPKIVIFRKS